MSSPQHGGVDRARNVRLALILASVAATFLIGFVVKIVTLGGA
nr:cytochrome oxidase small assembly protein [uncultured Aquabacterium sp.]